MSNIKLGTRILESGSGNVFVVVNGDLALESWGAKAYRHSNWTIGQPINQGWTFDMIQRTVDNRGFSIIEKQRRTARKNGRNELYLAASKEGMTFKGIANKVNERKVDTFGLSATQALSRYEDKFGKKLDMKEAVVFKLVPFSVRIDKKNGRVRLGRQIKGV